MLKYSIYKKVFLFGLLFFLTLLLFCFSSVNQLTNNGDHSELYSVELNRLSSIQKISYYIDSLYYKENKSENIDTIRYVKISSDVVKKRFYHGLSHYSINDNWIASILGKFFWSHLSAIVIPDDILKHSEGLCSQQTIVFLEILKQKGINFRTIGLGYREGPGHFLSEVRYSGSWHLFDVAIEPKWEKISNHHKSLHYYLQNKDSMFLVYNGRIERRVFDKIMEKYEYGNINETPAKNMFLFHKFTFLLTYILPVLFFILFVISLYKLNLLKKHP